jgi:cytochrome c55X
MPTSRLWLNGCWRIKSPEFDAIVVPPPWETAVSLLSPFSYERNRLLILIALLASFVLLSNSVVYAAPAMPNAARRAELIRMVRNDCGSCHGIRLTGGLGLSLTAEALREKPDSTLVATILYGRPGTPMPPWQGFMSESEAEWIVENLKLGFPNVKSH